MLHAVARIAGLLAVSHGVLLFAYRGAALVCIGYVDLVIVTVGAIALLVRIEQVDKVTFTHCGCSLVGSDLLVILVAATCT